MADETKIPGPGETPAPESHEPETPGPPAGFKQGVIPGIGDPPASSDKVINLSEVLEGAGGGDGAAVAGKKDPPAPEEGDPPAGPTKKVKALEDDERQEWEIPSAELEARKQKPKRGRTPKTEKGQDISGKGKRAAPGKGGPSAPGKTGRAPKAAAKEGPVTENPPAPTVDPPAPRDASSGVEEKVEYINLSELHPSPLNPFGVRDDVEMQALVESVKTGRVNQPALVRPREDGGYEIIAGHRRHKASYIKAQADYQTRKLAQEHPEAMKNALSRQWHRHKLKKQYQKQAREAAAKQGAKAAGKTTAATGRAVAGFVKRHPVGALILAACFLLLLIMQSCMSQMVSLGNATVGAVAASTYPAEDADLLGAEAAYVAMEGELQDYLDSYESTHSYDEYHFDLDEIEHDPYNLLSILCALHEGAWTVDEVRGTLQMLFDRQYILTEDVVVETRYYTDTRTDSEGNEYDVEVPYDYYICYVTLSNENLSKLPIYIMGEEALSRYALFMATLGNRPDLFPGSGYVGKYITNPPPEYEVPEEYLADERFAAILAEAEKYIGYPYVWGGYSPSTSFDCSGFVSWVINHSGWDVGRLGATSLYNICTRTSSPRPGDLVFFVGTYDTTGVSHCGIYVGDGIMLHCGDPIQYSNLNSSYWQSHFYAYGRLP